MYFEITSAQNEKIKAAKKAISDGKDGGVILIEGEKPVWDAVSNGILPRFIFSSEKNERSNALAKDNTVYFVPPFIMEKIADTRTPQSLCMIAERPCAPEILPDGRYILCENIQDPKNLGAMIRTADAFGIKGMLLIGSTADEFSPKATRGAMGSNLYLPIKRIDYGELSELKKRFSVYGTVLNERAVPLGNTEIDKNAIIAIGNEGKGLTEKLLTLCDKSLYIPMRGRAQSLNAGVAAAVIMWEISK